MLDDKVNDYKVVIAYDFGTTYSGASYAFTHNPIPEIFDVQKWPHKGGHYYPKTPTLSVYKRANPSVLRDWGHGAKKVMLRPHAEKENILLKNFKLDLDETLHDYVLDDILKGFATNYDPQLFRYCLTVPAMWSDLAKYSMRRAAIRAALIKETDPPDKLMLISEPEAAALYCERMCEQVNLRKGDRILICDAGGGTVDLTVFEVLTEEGRYKRSQHLKEIAKGMGESCGSVFLDENFRLLLQEKLSEQYDKIPAAALNNLMEQFVDNIKPEFDGLDDHYLNLPAIVNLEDLMIDDCSLDEGTLVLRANELKEKVFEPIIQRVLSLLTKQYEQISDRETPIDCIFLVGGFGSSNYLYERVQQVFGNRVRQILCPPRAAMAVVRGAVYFGLDPRVIISRVSRRTYGINAGLPFDESRDPISSRIVRPDGSVRCTSRFLPFVQKGDEVPVDHCITERMFVYYGSMPSTDIILYATDSDRLPRYYDSPDVHQVAAITVPIPYIPNATKGEKVTYTVR
ncbi:hypothetical protein BDF20DRAFT_907002 [Mycotypha africana]|uniref:uncharacterized protein n=1 Tax=Mycotypha africana TaxID=64632 RepID=UPI002301BFC0|nr:uncharacterized protein BDF20DRAFT_907002 [Mycotypha africana]KAI8973362.1 hypothetical protein BDF20DRAFT_907002 [Mycotypha africana]